MGPLYNDARLYKQARSYARGGWIIFYILSHAHLFIYLFIIYLFIYYSFIIYHLWYLFTIYNLYFHLLILFIHNLFIHYSFIEFCHLLSLSNSRCHPLNSSKYHMFNQMISTMCQHPQANFLINSIPPFRNSDSRCPRGWWLATNDAQPRTRTSRSQTAPFAWMVERILWRPRVQRERSLTSPRASHVLFHVFVTFNLIKRL